MMPHRLAEETAFVTPKWATKAGDYTVMNQVSAVLQQWFRSGLCWPTQQRYKNGIEQDHPGSYLHTYGTVRAVLTGPGGRLPGRRVHVLNDSTTVQSIATKGSKGTHLQASGPQQWWTL
ncbi:hypothetical protein VaNZ11_016683 [Volvox africanus]|uniref:Uncharacterized protein n=1 Tax=Volvox africanus TaxID=51714 RepID=A0ABQ5SPA8_9CHLO|nr:hypothetical protein VaNZ11_016683 [Volvox africanus]